MGVNVRMSTPNIGYKRLQCVVPMILSGPKWPACMKPSMAFIFLSSCASHKHSFKAPKSFFCGDRHDADAHAIYEHCSGSALLPSFYHFFGSSIWMRLHTKMVPQVTFMHVEVSRGWLAPCFTHHKRQAQPVVLVRYLELEPLPNNPGDVCEHFHHVGTPFGCVCSLL
jgi:hypothetical protein